MSGIREQRSGLGQRQTGQRRAVQQQPASQQYTGHYAGIPEEDNELELEEGDEYYDTRPHTSVRRYDRLPVPEDQVFQQGNQRFHIHHAPPPVTSQKTLKPQRAHQYFKEDRERKPRGHFHPLVYVGIPILIMIAGYIAFTLLGNWWQNTQLDWTYGKTRTFQIDAVVGHGDSPTSPTHFIACNLNGQIVVLEVSQSDPTKARRYNVTTIEGNAGNPPVKLSFQDVNADGRPDVLVQIGDPSSGTAFTIILLNDGTQFVSKLSK